MTLLRDYNYKYTKLWGTTRCPIIYIVLCTATLLFLVGLQVSAQTLYLVPHIGMELPTCYVVKPSPENSVMKTSLLPITPIIGGKLVLQAPSDKWNISFGYGVGAITRSAKVKFTDKQIERALEQAPPGAGVIGSHSEAKTSYVHCFTLLYTKILAPVYLFRMHQYEGGHLIAFEPFLRAGPEFLYKYDNLIRNNPGFSFIQDTLGGYDPNVTFSNLRFPNKNTFAVHLGAGAQFYFRGKPAIALEVYYKQGFRDMLAVDVDYQLIMDGHDHIREQVRSRGSAFGAVASFPIKLIRFGKASRVHEE